MTLELSVALGYQRRVVAKSVRRGCSGPRGERTVPSGAS